MDFFDSHCHFDFVEFDEDRDAVWDSCQAMGVAGLVIPGVSPEQWQKVAAITQAHPGIYYGVGLHPWFIKDVLSQNIQESDPQQLASFCEQLRQQLTTAARNEKCIAIGECGLDAMIETPLSLQQVIFNVHLQVASELSMPIIIHCRKAHNEIIKSLSEQKIKSGGVIHAFSGSIDLARQYWALGFYLGIGGTITYERANKTRAAAKQLPIEAMLLETDAPDMPLNGKQGQRNSPTYIPEVAQALADIRSESLLYIAQKTTANAQKLFFNFMKK